MNENPMVQKLYFYSLIMYVLRSLCNKLCRRDDAWNETYPSLFTMYSIKEGSCVARTYQVKGDKLHLTQLAARRGLDKNTGVPTIDGRSCLGYDLLPLLGADGLLLPLARLEGRSGPARVPLI